MATPEALHRRHLLLARLAPRRPEVQEDHLAVVLGETERLAVRHGEREVADRLDLHWLDELERLEGHVDVDDASSPLRPRRNRRGRWRIAGRAARRGLRLGLGRARLARENESAPGHQSSDADDDDDPQASLSIL